MKLKLEHLLAQLAKDKNISFIENNKALSFPMVKSKEKVINILINKAGKPYQYLFGKPLQLVDSEDIDPITLLFLFDALIALSKAGNFHIE
ncbi:hypothetical protein [Facilibium subflavum]|uniref:hypothetical protein n=1 Tax=Facilibium subflavum TaxID=2219058 RepID=UPI000E64B966|nr:hypothetical protein [Facilibium subflavum]